MKTFFLVILFLHVNLFAEVLDVGNFKANVFAKSDKKPVEVSASLMFEGSDVKKQEHKVIDALNIVIGSYYAEDLVTSRGKEVFKATLIAYAKKTYALGIDHIYIKEMTVKTNPSTHEIVEALKKEGVFQQNTQPRQQHQQQSSLPQYNLSPPLPRKAPLLDESSDLNQ